MDKTAFKNLFRNQALADKFVTTPMTNEPASFAPKIQVIGFRRARPSAPRLGAVHDEMIAAFCITARRAIERDRQRLE